MSDRESIEYNYIESLLPERSAFFQDLEREALQKNIPIMDPEGMQVLLTILEIHQPLKILEIGTAVGYSALRMLEVLPEAEIITMERDPVMAEAAERNIERAGESARVRIIRGDALESVQQAAAHAPFDVLFIDAAKGQYEKFFQLYEPLVHRGGLILSDNVLFKGYVSGQEPVKTRSVRSMVSKLREYNENLMNNPRFASSLLSAGDGLMVTRKR
ncbi:O-methyltransferase [Alkalicoccus chagannorensis]|uniref:O-methyltransferase n=1 Tax=Alkalicoccus chagannorensis TaxID=427072 RepID=UPI0004039DC9|nr:O-methyltransferase [Alkalicoccus chagannorensis]